MKPIMLLSLIIAAALLAAPLRAENPSANPLPAAAALTAPAAQLQDNEEEPDPDIRPNEAWRGKEARLFRWFGNSLSVTRPTLDGATLQLPRDLLGKVTILHFWSTSGFDIPHIRAFYDRYHDQGLEIIGINGDKDRNQVETFIRGQGLAWPQTFTGKGTEDPLMKRLDITEFPVWWVVGYDGRVVWGRVNHQGWAPLESLNQTVEGIFENESELAERLSFYRSGEFLTVTPLLQKTPAVSGSKIPAAAVEAIRAKIHLPGWTAGSKAEKIRSFKDVITAGQSLEKSYPSDPNLLAVRSWMLVAARWLAVTTNEKIFNSEAATIAKRLLASSPTPASSLLADYVVTSARLAERKPQTKAGSRLIQDYVARYAGSDAAWAAQVLAVMLTLEDGQNSLREQLVQQLGAAYTEHPDPMLGGFLRDSCNLWPKPLPFRAQLTRMDGSKLTLPDDLLGKVVILQFWSAAHPPKPAMLESPYSDVDLQYTGLATVPSDGVVVVGINLDRNKSDAEAFLKKNMYPDWIHTFSGLGWDDPTARACDILALPRAVVLNRGGEIATLNRLTGRIQYDFRHTVEQLVAQPATKPRK